MKICLTCATRFSGQIWKCPECGWEPPVHSGYPLLAPEVAFENDGFDPSVFERLISMESGSFWFRNRNKLLKYVIGRYFKDAQSLLEIGCGTGYVLSALGEAHPELKLVGGDIYCNAFGYASQRAPQAEFIQVDARCLPYENEFDVIGAFDMLEHTDDDEEILRQMNQAVAPGGGIIITVPQHRWLWSSLDDISYHRRRYTRKELIMKLERAGFQPYWVTSFVSLLLPLMIMSRFRYRLPGNNNRFRHTKSELRLPANLDLVFEIICNAERYLLTGRRRFSLPIGGSLLAVGFNL